jgi:hypothetical protein
MEIGGSQAAPEEMPNRGIIEDEEVKISIVIDCLK